MQIGIVTMDGRQVGVVAWTEGTTPDPFVPDLGGYESAALSGRGPEAPTRHHHFPGHHDSDHHAPRRHWVGHHASEAAQPMKLQPGDDPRGLEPYIRERAAHHGVNPDTAVRVARSEGLRDFEGDHGTSFGAFQLHKNGGLGDEFQKETGLDPANPANEKAGIDWALKNLSRTGWAPYHGAGRVGVGKWQGIGERTEAVKSPSGEPAAFIFHHTGGRGTVQGVQNTLRERGLGVQYIMDRDGNIVVSGGHSHMLPGWGKGEGLSNRNTVGMEVIARDNTDVTPAQIAAAKAFIEKNYSATPVYGHGEVNPGHKEADEGMAIVNTIRASRAKAKSATFDPETMAP